MALIKRIISVGKTSKGVILPKSWLDFLESKHGKIDSVSMEVNGKLTIRPILKEAQRRQHNK
jgi:antitoxin component of MazEF toxin-antitoxin module